MIARLRQRITTAARWTSRQPGISGLLRTYARADGLRFMRWAAAIALFGYLAIFPLLVLAFIAFGIVLDHYPGIRSEVEDFLKESVPLLFDPAGGEAPVDIQDVARTTSAAGVVSVIGLLLAGLGWVDASVEGVRRMQGAMHRTRNAAVSKLQEIGALLAIGTVLLLALLASVAVQALADAVLDWAGVGTEAAWIVRFLGPLVSGLLVWVVLIALYAGAWHDRPTRQWRSVLLGAMWGSVTLVIMLQLSLLIVGRTLSNPVYGTLAVAAALLLFLYFASAVVLFFAAWVAVREGAPATEEELAYARRKTPGGDIRLPVATASARDLAANVEQSDDVAATTQRQ